MTSPRKLAVIAGVCYLITHVTSVAALVLYGPVLHDAGFAAGHGSATGVLTGALLEVICAVAIVGTAAALFPVVKRHRAGGAMAYTGLRTLEAGIILAGVAALLAVVALRQHGAGAASTGTAPLVTAGQALVAVHNATFLLGPNCVCAVDTLVLAYAMWQSQLIPRLIAGLGLAGGLMLAVSAIAILFGAYPQVSLPGAVAALPVFAWELSLAVFLIVKGFRPAAAGYADRPPSDRPAALIPA